MQGTKKLTRSIRRTKSITWRVLLFCSEHLDEATIVCVCVYQFLHTPQKYFQSGTEAETRLTVEWTNQHGCGGNEDSDTHKLNCNLVIQYMVQDYAEFGSSQEGTLGAPPSH